MVPLIVTDKEQTNDLDNMDGAVSPGDLSALLVKYREAANLDIDQIADALCLTPSTVQALESEAFDKLPESPYVRGYLRNYAKLAHQDPRHIIQVYNTLRGEPSTEEQVSKLAAQSNYHEVANPLITPQRFRLGLLAATLLLLALLTMIPGVRNWIGGLWSGFSGPAEETIATEDGNGIPRNLPSLTADLPGNLPIASGENQATANTENSPQNTDTPDKEKTTGEAGTDAVADASSQDQAQDNQAGTEATTADTQANATRVETETATTEANTDNAEQAATPGDTRLKFVFSDEVWLRIRDANGKTLYEALHPAGTEKELSLNSPLKLKVGNAPAMTLYVNGEAMDVTPFTRGSVAKFGIE